MQKDSKNFIQYNSIIQDAFPEYNFYPSILQRPLKNKCWNLNLPNISDVEGIVLHTQDNLNVTDNGIFTELIEIENFYSDKNIKNIIVVHWNHGLDKLYEGPLKLIELPTHSFDFIQNYKRRFNEWKDVENKTFENNFMCLNGYPRKHRTFVFDYLNNLNIKSLVSISNKVSNIPKALRYSNYTFDNTQNFINLMPLYKSTAVNVVTETLYFESCGIITEKTLQAFGAMQLPIIIGHKGAVTNIKEYGFDMFDDILDNSYDSMDNDIRWKCALQLNEHVLLNNFDYKNIKKRLKKNQEHLLNVYPKILIDNFKQKASEIFS